MVRSAPRDDDHFIAPNPAGCDERRAMRIPDLRWQLASTCAPNALRRQSWLWWQYALVALRRPVWLAAIVALLVLGLLLAFQQVVAQAVAQGELRRTATAAQARDIWRCKHLSHSGARDSCLERIGGAEDHMSPQGRRARAATNVAAVDSGGSDGIVLVHTFANSMEK